MQKPSFFVFTRDVTFFRLAANFQLFLYVNVCMPINLITELNSAELQIKYVNGQLA